MKIEAMTRRIPFLSRKRFEKKSGRVMESPQKWLYLRSLRPTIFQLRYVPITRPMPIHASEKPLTNTAPGRPIRSQPLMSEACADIATTHLFMPRLPR